MTEEVAETKQVILKTVYTFVFGRNIYTVRMSDIKKVTLLEHNFVEKKDDSEEITKSLYIFSVIGDQIQGVLDNKEKPLYETIIEVKAEESDYSSLYNIYEDLVKSWDAYQLLTIT